MRAFIEKLVTKQDYFHLPHTAERDPSDPCKSYYYDLRERINYPGITIKGIPVVVREKDKYASAIGGAQLGLAYLQHFWDSGDEGYLRNAEDIARSLTCIGKESNRGLLWPSPTTVNGYSNWLSSMVQSQAASLLLRVGSLTGEKFLLDSGRAALLPLDYDINNGGVRTTLNGYLWFEEYAIEPPSYTLNGFIVTLFGVRDAAIILEDEHYYNLWEKGVESLKVNLHLFDSDGWSLYDLSLAKFGFFSVKNFASPFYQRFHIELLKTMEQLTGDQVFAKQRKQWAAGLAKGVAFYRGVLGKIMYRVLRPTQYLKAGTDNAVD